MNWVLITGASARGGQAIARHLHAQGLNIIAHHSPRSTEVANNVADELNAMRSQSVLLWEADFAKALTLPNWLIALAPTFCVCNASVYQPSELNDALRKEVDMAVHLYAHATILATLRSSLRSVVAISDIHVAQPAPAYVWYTVAKAGLQALALTLAIDWAPDVRLNVVAPGALPFPSDWTNHPRQLAIEASIPMGRLGEFVELASTVSWLLIQASYITGQVIALDGGRSRLLA